MGQIKADTLNLQESVIHINRVAKVVKGGRRFSFTALVAVGDGESTVGVGYGKAKEVPLAIQKAIDDARKNLFVVPKHGTTITHEILGRHGAGRVLLRPASAGTGVIAGGGVRALLELGGVHDVLTKCLGTTNPINMVRAAEQGLRSLRRPEDIAMQRGKTLVEVLGERPKTTASAPAGPKAAPPAAAPSRVTKPVAPYRSSGPPVKSGSARAAAPKPQHKPAPKAASTETKTAPVEEAVGADAAAAAEKTVTVKAEVEAPAKKAAADKADTAKAEAKAPAEKAPAKKAAADKVDTAKAEVEAPAEKAPAKSAATKTKAAKAAEGKDGTDSKKSKEAASDKPAADAEAGE